MSEVNTLPQGWVSTQLGELFSFNPKSQEDDESNAGFVPMSMVPRNYGNKIQYEQRTWGEIKKGYTHFKDGDVIFAKITPCFENSKAAIVSDLPNGYGAGSTEYYVLRPLNNFVNTKFLYSIIKSSDFLHLGAMEMTGAVGHKRVPKAFVLDYPLALPPLNEQTRIANKLDELLAQVDTIKARVDAIPSILKRFRQSVLAAAVSGKLTEKDRDNAQYTPPKETWNSAQEIEYQFDIPSSWIGVSLGSVSEKVSVGHVGKTTEFYTNEENGIPFLRSQNVRPGYVSKAGLAYITYDFHEKLKKSQLQEGDLLVVRVGANRGDSCVLPKMFELVNCANIVFARPLSGLSRYLNIYFQSPKSQELLLGESVGGAQGVINTKSVQNTFLALPPIEEQTQIVQRVEQLFAFADQIEQRVNDAQARINNLTQSILAKAFRGELVPQDPSDEPASELLARIQQEREAADALAKAAKKATKAPAKRRKKAPETAKA